MAPEKPQPWRPACQFSLQGDNLRGVVYMITQFKDWYTIEEVSEIFECKTEDIIHFIRAGKLNTVLWLDNAKGVYDHGERGQFDISLNGLWATLTPHRFGLKNGDTPVVYNIEAENPEKSFKETFSHTVSSIDEVIELKKDGFYHAFAYDSSRFIIATSVTRVNIDTDTVTEVILRKEIDSFKSIITMNHSNRVSEILNKDHPWYSPELAFAINAWFALYADHEGRKGENAFKPHGGHKQMIASWLEDNFDKDTSPTSREHIAAVVSPCRAPGQGSCPPWHAKVKKQP